MDGNGRWAKRRMLPRSAGHRKGMDRMISLSEHAFDLGVEYVTLYALSAENLSRPKEELDGLFALFCKYFGENVERLVSGNIRLRVIGDPALLPPEVVRLAREGEKATEKGTRGTLVLAIGYGARQEILAAVNAAVHGGKELTREEFAALLQTDGIPDPDFLIRTGKEKRLSNFLLWQCAYTELFFSEKLFPAFTNADLDRALADYAGRERRYGKITVSTDGDRSC